MKIQLTSESDSQATPSPAQPSTPSRLVNMHLHDADLAKQKEESKNPTRIIEKIDVPALLPPQVSIKPAEPKDKLSIAIEQARANNPIDEIAHTAAESIASIRVATDTEDVATQFSSLRDFANKIKTDDSLPGVSELAGTIEQFINIAEKSSGAKSAEAAIKVKKSSARPAMKPIKQHTAKSLKVTKTTKPAKVAAKANARAKANTKSVHGDAALKNAMRKVATMDEPPRARKVRRRGSVKRFLLAFGCSAACVAAIIYFVGSNIPDISVRVAAMQTGVEASYPSYVPREFSLEDIKSEHGKITLTFTTTDNQKFTLIEEKSAWDSTALQRNYVTESWGDDFSTTHEQGITIFIHNSSAAWVNGGVLYKINAESGVLTKKQLRNIVTSM